MFYQLIPFVHIIWTLSSLFIHFIHSYPLSCNSVRELYQPFSHTFHRHHQHSFYHSNAFHHHSSHSILGGHRTHQELNCPTSADTNNCCHNLDEAIGLKASEQFIEEIRLLFKISTFEQQFLPIYNRIYQTIDSIINDTVLNIDNALIGQRRILVANKNLFDFIRELIFDSKPDHNTDQLAEYVDRLLESIFITVLRYQHKEQKEYPPDYESCLLNTLKENDFLLSSKEEMLTRFTRTIDSSRLIMHLLENTLLLINQTNELNVFDRNCVRSLSSTFHCSRCMPTIMAGTDWKEPCVSVCYETITKCLNEIYLMNLDKTMKHLANSFQQLVNLLVYAFNPENLLSSHLAVIERAKSNISTNNVNISRISRIACGPLKRYFRSAATITANAYDYYNYSTPTPTSSTFSSLSPNGNEQDGDVIAGKSLYISIQSVAHLFTKHRDMFVGLPEKMCQKYSDHLCWNGTDVVSDYRLGDERRRPQLYSSSTNANFSESLDNLYYQVQRIDSTIQELLNNQKLSSRFSHFSLSNGNDNLDLYSEDGSGSGSNPSSDDEDYNSMDEGSGGEVMIDSSTETTDSGSDIIIDPIISGKIYPSVDTDTKSPDSSSLHGQMLDVRLILFTIITMLYTFLC